MNKQRKTRNFKQLWTLQCTMALSVMVVFMHLRGSQAAVSALLGGFICIIPNACFALMLFQYQGARAANRIVKSFYQGEALKIVLSTVLFTLVFVLYRVDPVAFFVSYIVAIMTQWFSPLMISNKKQA